jgi:hypothetical protein
MRSEKSLAKLACLRAAAIVVLGLTGLGGCASDRVDASLGARCVDSGDCVDRCLPPSADYPGGMCTLACTADSECPSDAACVQRVGGVCLFTCRDDSDCSLLGSVSGLVWRCHEDMQGSGPARKVCLGPGK